MAKISQVPDVQGAPAIPSQKGSSNFCDYAVDHFNPDRVVRKLFDHKKETRWESPLLFEGLCAWTLANGNAKFVRDNVVRHIGDVLAEREITLKKKHARSGRGFVALMGEADLIPLFDRAFDPIGGMAAIMDACSKIELEKDRQSRAGNAKSVVDIMSVIHLYASTNGSKAPHPAKMSIQLACKLVEGLQMRRKRSRLSREALGADRLRDRWDEMARSSMLIYAASLLEYHGASLFDMLFATSPRYFHKRVLRWLKLAKRISRDVRKHCKFHYDKKPRFIRFPKGMKAKKLPSPKLRLCEAMWLVENFQGVPKGWPAVEKDVVKCARARCSISESATPATACVACARFKGQFDSVPQPIIARY